ncbi:hypothetical protein HPB51_013124 [Rhipicephalus microplus]|uniref:G-protein coupled receptors family 2 profile 2 domain-containing protein n=1 Tax=Rhipicephalus microplus TaxID=6941 RepID=A0A9J6D581_RHIMP|nr:hypothetical protein HPB51_013124 [Rhipicephalus microplus]
MFCEGLYLHTLLVLAFIAEDKILKWFLLIGWGAYTTKLVVRSSGKALSFAFLVNIVRVLVTKLRAVNSPDNESTRKAVRATVILLPLLGLHYVVTPFRPDKGSILLAYEIISALVTSLQGLCVALLFCFFNGEVLGVLRKTLSQTPWFRNKARRMSYANTSISFMFYGKSHFYLLCLYNPVISVCQMCRFAVLFRNNTVHFSSQSLCMICTTWTNWYLCKKATSNSRWLCTVQTVLLRCSVLPVLLSNIRCTSGTSTNQCRNPKIKMIFGSCPSDLLYV